MVSNMLKLMLCLLVLKFLHQTSSGQRCKEKLFPAHKVYDNCKDLPHLSSFLHWTYSEAIGDLDIAFRHTEIASNRWVAWAINPKNNINNAMIGAQALVAIPQSNGNAKSEVVIYATLTLPIVTKSLVHLWQDGPLVDSVPQMHELDYPHLHSKEVLHLV
ncbi:hypothetical protein L195_g024373 [Trifolium pratense]|uniref:AIR12 DOMON domain-containing protein n=1 Tax=Trifolium pratense TaxID=57577 RepID=A0A2K3NDI0_TRIPR|nr:hypothetical protein L195_g024373 [Trifolium pratense]